VRPGPEGGGAGSRAGEAGSGLARGAGVAAGWGAAAATSCRHAASLPSMFCGWQRERRQRRMLPVVGARRPAAEIPVTGSSGR
jgi:hypothetical protein